MRARPSAHRRRDYQTSQPRSALTPPTRLGRRAGRGRSGRNAPGARGSRAVPPCQIATRVITVADRGGRAAVRAPDGRPAWDDGEPQPTLSMILTRYPQRVTDGPHGALA